MIIIICQLVYSYSHVSIDLEFQYRLKINNTGFKISRFIQYTCNERPPAQNTRQITIGTVINT